MISIWHNLRTLLKKSICVLMLLPLCLLTACTSTDTMQTDNPNYDSANYLSGTHYVRMEIENYGSIELALDADTAPATVTNFINLVQEGFYNGLTFHRIIDGFMIQGGDPDGNGTGGSAHTVPGEFASNGVDNNISHVRGTISMARTKAKDSASSQFFIVHQDSIYLDGDYAGFGTVLSGMEVVDAICETVPVVDGNGSVHPENQPVISSITVIEETDVTK